jgi:ElaB/YqjD/DUF883 family membrane-anchored ribosome-binding protein
MENLKSVLADLLIQAKPYAIVGGVCFVVGLILGAWL